MKKLLFFAVTALLALSCGRRNEPANVRYVGMKMAEIRGEDPEEVAAYTTENAKKVYNL